MPDWIMTILANNGAGISLRRRLFWLFWVSGSWLTDAAGGQTIVRAPNGTRRLTTPLR